MSLGDTTENELALLIFNAVAMADIAEDDSSSPATEFDVALHVNPGPTEPGFMSWNEASYTGYARQTIARTSGGWTVVGSDVSNATVITFPKAESAHGDITNCSIGKTGGGATQIIAWGPLASPIDVYAGVVPEFAIGALNISWD